MTTLATAPPAPAIPGPPDPFTVQLAGHALGVVLADRSGLSVGVVTLRDGCLGLVARHVDDDGTGPRLVVKGHAPSGVAVIAYGPRDGGPVEVGWPLLVRGDITNTTTALADVVGMLTAWRRRQDELRATDDDA